MPTDAAERAVLYDVRERVAVITLNRLEADSEAWVGVLCANTGDQERPVFCAGASDIVVATTRSAFGLPEVKRNLVVAAGGLFRLPRAIGSAVAMDVVLTGEPITAERAYALGRVSRLVEPGQALDEALRVAAQIVNSAPLAVRASRRVVRDSLRDDDELRALSARLLSEVLASKDSVEGLAAFAEKRAPQWQGE